MKSAIMRAFPPSGGDDLLGMEIDFNAFLYGLDVLTDAQARRTDDPARLIEATATAKRGAVDEVVSGWRTRGPRSSGTTTARAT